MVVVIVLVAVLLAVRGAGALGVAGLDSWVVATRYGLAAMLVFTAGAHFNVHAARAQVTLGGRPATPLWLRAPLQLLFIALTWWVAVISP